MNLSNNFFNTCFRFIAYQNCTILWSFQVTGIELIIVMRVIRIKIHGINCKFNVTLKIFQWFRFERVGVPIAHHVASLVKEGTRVVHSSSGRSSFWGH